MIGSGEILIIIAAAVFLFGGKKVVDWAKSLGEAKRTFDNEVKKNPEKEDSKESKKSD